MRLTACLVLCLCCGLFSVLPLPVVGVASESFVLVTTFEDPVPDPLPKFEVLMRCFTSAGVKMGGGSVMMVSMVTAFLGFCGISSSEEDGTTASMGSVVRISAILVGLGGTSGAGDSGEMPVVLRV